MLTVKSNGPHVWDNRHDPIIISVVRWRMNNIHTIVPRKLFIHWKETV